MLHVVCMMHMLIVGTVLCPLSQLCNDLGYNYCGYNCTTLIAFLYPMEFKALLSIPTCYAHAGSDLSQILPHALSNLTWL